MSSGRAAVVVVAGLVLVAGVDAVRSGGVEHDRPPTRNGYRIDLASSRPSTNVPVAQLLRAFPGPAPDDVAVSKVAVASDDVVAVALSYVPGDRPSRAAIELWDGLRLVDAFTVPVGSFSLGLWFAGDGAAIATIGWDERARVYDRDGRTLGDDAYFAYSTG